MSLNLWLSMFWLKCFWSEVTLCNVLTYNIPLMLFSIFTQILHFETTDLMTLLDISCPRWYSPTQWSDLSDMKFIKQIFREIWCICLNSKAKIVARSSCTCCWIWLPISICLDLSFSFAMFGSLSSYFLVLMQLMIGYCSKCTYRIPKIFHIFSTLKNLYSAIELQMIVDVQLVLL